MRIWIALVWLASLGCVDIPNQFNRGHDAEISGEDVRDALGRWDVESAGPDADDLGGPTDANPADDSYVGVPDEAGPRDDAGGIDSHAPDGLGTADASDTGEPAEDVETESGPWPCEPDDCDDGDPCTVDACNEGICSHLPTQGPCDDEDACTDSDLCLDGVCAGSPMGCDDGKPCTLDSCDPALGCFAVDDPALCEDGNPCTDHACTASGGCTSTPNAAPCDDGDPCSVDDGCEAGTCQGDALGVCADGGICPLGGCPDFTERFVAVGNSTICTSVDGLVWECADSPTGQIMTDVTFGSGSFVAVGQQACRSDDGQSWECATWPNQNAPWSVLHANQGFTTVGATGEACSSETGVEWTCSPTPVGPGVHLVGLAHGNGIYVASSTDASACSSEDAVDWTCGPLDTTEELPALAFGAGIFLTTGENNAVCTSESGLQWSCETVGEPAMGWQAATWGGETFAIVGSAGDACVGTVGAWMCPGTNGTGTLRDIVHGSDRFVAVGEGSSCVSLDGTLWNCVPLEVDLFGVTRGLVPEQ